MAKQDTQVHWRDAARKTKFFAIDAAAAFPLLLFLLHMRVWSFVIALICTIFFAILAQFGFTFRIFGVRLRSIIAGHHKAARPWWRQ